MKVIQIKQLKLAVLIYASLLAGTAGEPITLIMTTLAYTIGSH